MLALVMLFIGGWLHTYNVFTEKSLVAEVTIYPVEQDENGKYFRVDYKPYIESSALSTLISTNNNISGAGEVQQFKIYGDSIHLGGPIVKFYDHLILVNFKTIYKVGKLFGRYDINNDQELNRKVQSSYDLNGGIDETWKLINDRINEWPYVMFFETTEIDTKGVFAPTGNTPANYNFYITNQGFRWEKTN